MTSKLGPYGVNSVATFGWVVWLVAITNAARQIQFANSW